MNINKNEKFKVLREIWGYDSFRTGQERLIDSILENKDVIGIMPTGAGKSLCYQVPAIMMPGITLVVSPLISLMNDQVQALVQLGIRGAYINSSLNPKVIPKVLRLAAEGTYKIIYIAPERLESPEFLEFVDSVEISMVTVDEAHCISQWGQDFRPGYLKIADFINRFEKKPVVSAFTATATDKVRNDIIEKLELKDPEMLVTGFDRNNLYFGVEHLYDRDKYNYIKRYVMAHSDDSGIIYCGTRKKVDEIHEKLCEDGISAGKYHAGMGDEERMKNQMDFIYDRCSVMVATNAFGMGIDKSNVRYVLHHNMPQSLEYYYQEAGRAGRDGEAAECILLYSKADVRLNQFLIENKEDNPELSEEEKETVKENDIERLKKMTFYSTERRCLRKNMLNYFGEKAKSTCRNCSNCKGERKEKDITDYVISIIRCLMEEDERFGMTMVAGILLGSAEDRIYQRGLNKLSSYGCLSALSRVEVYDLIDYMIAEEYIYVTTGEYKILKLGEKSNDIILSGKLKNRIMMLEVINQESLTYRSKKKNAPEKSKAIAASDLNENETMLFDELRKIRAGISEVEGVPRYIIFSDKTLLEMSKVKPMTQEEMMNVSGVGLVKYDKYGSRFLKAIIDFSNKNQ